MPSITLIWFCIHDQRTCPVCLALHGYQWTFETGKDTFPTELFHPQFGVVWNIAQGSEAHANHRETCRCGITYETDLSDLVTKTKQLLSKLQSAVQTGDTKGDTE